MRHASRFWFYAEKHPIVIFPTNMVGFMRPFLLAGLTHIHSFGTFVVLCNA
jgi:hypothetical protein